MVGNVTGVSQLLETVGVAGPQGGAETAPGKTFATVMQQTSEQNGTPLPTPVAGKQAEGDGAGKGASSSASAQKIATPTQETAKAVSGKDKDANAASVAGRKWGAVSVAVDKTSLVSLTGRIVPQPQPSQQDEILLASVAGTDGKALKGTGEAAKITVPVAVVPSQPVVTTGATIEAANDAAGKAALQPETLPQAIAPALKGTDAGAGQKVEDGARRVGKETPSVGGKPVSKQGDSKVDFALTALVPQSVPEVPQVFVAAPDVSAAVVVTAPVMVASSAGDAGASATAENATVGAASSIQGLQGPRVQGTQVQAAPKQGSAVVKTALPLAGDSGVKVDAEAGTVPVAGKPIVATEKPLPQVVAVDGVVAAVAQVQAMQTQQSVTAGSASQEETGAGIESPAGLASRGAAAVAKPPVQGGRNNFNASKSVTETVTDSGFAGAKQEVPSAAAISSAHAAPAAQAAQPSGSRAAATPAVAKTALKAADKTVAFAANVQPVDVQGAVPVKTAVPAELAGATVTAKDKPEAVVEAVAAQPVAATAGLVNHAAPVTVPAIMPAIQAPLPHAPVAANAGVTDTAGVVSAMRAETNSAAGGSLPHTTLSATPNSLEVGVSSGTHGWLKIRAELNAAGEVNASLTGANPAAASRLRSELPALSSFLQDEKLAMGTLDVRSALHTAAFENSSTFSQAGMGGSTGTAVGADAGAAGGRAQQQAQQGGENVPVLSGGTDSDKVLPGRSSDTATYGNTTELGGNEASSLTGYGAGGSWLNVRV